MAAAGELPGGGASGKESHAAAVTYLSLLIAAAGELAQRAERIHASYAATQLGSYGKVRINHAGKK
jgi:hypothetical protein